MAGAHVVAGSKHHYGDCCPVDPAECPLAHGQQPCPRCGAHEPHGRLFGKLTGVYWVPGHARGNPRRGVVLTDWDLRVDGAA